MHPAKSFAANLYYHGTLGCRLWRMKRACAAGNAPIGVLVFHRVADDNANAWTTSTATFRQAIRWLRQHVDLISLEEAQRRIRRGRNERVSMCVTFDDGYADNVQHALPLLVAEQVPCTYFVSVGPVFSGLPFAHDLVDGNRLLPNTIDQLRDLGGTCVEIGAHTRTHPDLGRVTDQKILADEIVRSRDELQQQLGTRIRYFAFPFGRQKNLTAQAVWMAHEAGYDGVCSAYGGYNVPGGDAFHLRRRCLDGPLLRIKNWVMVDPFRNQRVPEFSYA